MPSKFENLKKTIQEQRKTESPIEEVLCRWFCVYGLYGVSQYEVGRYRADIAFPEKKLIVECDGKDWHSSDEQIARDRTRDTWLNEQGWIVKRFSGRSIFEKPKEIVYGLVQEFFPELKSKQIVIELVEEIEGKPIHVRKQKRFVDTERMDFLKDEMWDLYEEEKAMIEEEDVAPLTPMYEIGSLLGEKAKWLSV